MRQMLFGGVQAMRFGQSQYSSTMVYLHISPLVSHFLFFCIGWIDGAGWRNRQVAQLDDGGQTRDEDDVATSLRCDIADRDDT